MPAVSNEARRLHDESIVIDLHVDPLIQQRLFRYDITRRHNSDWKPECRFPLPLTRYFYIIVLKIMKQWAYKEGYHHRFLFNHVDLPRMQQGGYTAGGFGLHFFPTEMESGWRSIRGQIKDFKDKVVGRGNIISLAKQPEDIRDAHCQGKLAGFLGVEGTHCLGKAVRTMQVTRLNRINELSELGVCYLTLAHFSRNDAISPSPTLAEFPFLQRLKDHLEDKPLLRRILRQFAFDKILLVTSENTRDSNTGLTDFGARLIRRMNQARVMIDLAHVSEQGIIDVCDVSTKPVVVTHTGLKAIYEHSRNISDKALRKVADTGGVVGVMFAMNFLAADWKNDSSRSESEQKRQLTLDVVYRHIDHIVQTVGEDYAAIGTDFDGWIPCIPTDMKDASCMPLLTQKMLENGYSSVRIKKILGENFLRVWEEVLS